MNLEVLQKAKKIFQLALKIAWIGFAKLFTVTLLACLLIVPGIVCLINFAFTELISFESPALDTKGVFMLSKELSLGHRKEIFLRLLASFGNALAVGICMLVLLMILNVFLDVSPNLFFIFVPLAVLVSGAFIVELNVWKVFAQIKQEKMLKTKA